MKSQSTSAASIRDVVARAVIKSVGSEELRRTDLDWQVHAIDNIFGFTSLCAVIATDGLEEALGLELGVNVFTQTDGERKRARSLDEVVSAIVALTEGSE